MKRIIGVCLCLSMVVSSFAFGMSAEAKSKYAPYKKILTNAAPASFDYCAYGFMYDFDNNGTKELVYQKSVGENPFPSDSYSLYTIKKSKAVKIVKNKKLVKQVGGCSSAVGVATKGKKKYLVVYTFNGGGSPINGNGSFILYTVKGTKAKVYKKYDYSFNTNMNGSVKSSSYKVNGKKCSFSVYKKQLKTFKYKYSNIYVSKYNVSLQRGSDQNSLSSLASSI